MFDNDPQTITQELAAMRGLIDASAKPARSVVDIDAMTGPQLATIVWSRWSTKKAMRLRTALNRLAEVRTGRRTRAGNAQDKVRYGMRQPGNGVRVHGHAD